MEREELAARIPGPEGLSRISAAYDRGQIPEALRLAEEFAPLRDWQGAKACALASRIATHLGSPLMATRLAVRALRADPTDAQALEAYGYEIAQRRGPLELRRVLRDHRRDDRAPADTADLLVLESFAALTLRDFAACEQLTARAESLMPARAWIHLQRAFLLERLDRLEEAVEIAKAACELHPYPFFRPGVQAHARLLQLLNRDDDAIDLLHSATAVLQSGPVVAQLYSLLVENGRWVEAESALQQFAILSPLLSSRGARWLTAEQARVAYRLGKRAAAAEFAKQIDDEFFQNFAQRLLEPPPTDETVRLDISFVRQHFKTCAPATLAAIGAFWKMPADHVRLAEAICYDGTPPWEQRDWAARNGWHVREFRVTRESALALLARRLPFAITTTEATSAHMMAVIGFDLTRDVLLLRDPSQPYVIEWPINAFFERYRAFGPRGMLFVPEGERSRIDGVDLPDEALYDDYHQLSLALAKHHRDDAARALEKLVARDPDALVTWDARLDLAAHDDNSVEVMRCLDKLLEIFPGNPMRLLRRLGYMPHASREDRIRFLEGPCSEPKAEPALLIALARALTGDARQHQEAWRCTKRALRLRPMDSEAIKARADLLWERGELEEAVEWHRFAALAEEFREHLWQSWFLACRQTRRVQQALEHLQDRFKRFGHQSAQPALTLAWAWNEVDQPQQARAVLKAAIGMRPDDGPLLLRSASLIAGLGETAEAHRLLELARGKNRENDWLRARMNAAERSLDYETVLAVARELLQKEPLALDVLSALARALSRREGVNAARKAIKDLCDAHPQHCGLRRSLLDWSRGAEPDVIIAAAEDLLRLEPSAAWALRELAFALTRLRRYDEALKYALEASRIEPNNSYSASTLAVVHQRAGRIKDARDELHRAVAASVDNNFAISALLDLARTDEERRADVAIIEQELLRQVVNGDGLIAYLTLARPILEPESLMAMLRRAHSERPDLWHAWAALVSQLVHTGALDEALQVASQATERFPYLPRAWLDLATVRKRRGEQSEEIKALEHAFEGNPGFGSAAMSLSSAYERAGRLVEARATCERALRHSPFDASLHSAHASLLWRLREVDAAFEAVERALRLSPEHRSAAEDLRGWAAQVGTPERAVTFARSLSGERSGDPQAWLLLAGILPSTETRERLSAVDRAIELDRQLTDAWDVKAQLLAADNQFDAAIEACEQGISICLTDVHVLAGRRAWIEASRRRFPEAIQLMRDVLTGNKGYAWGWYQLAGWLLGAGDTSGAMEALQTMRELWPHDTWVKRQLGFLYLQQKDPAAARLEFERSFELDPTDEVAAHNLLALQLDANDVEGASQTVQVMRAHQPGTPTTAAEIGVRLRQRDVAGALDLLAQLCLAADRNPWPIDEAADQFIAALQTERALPVMRRALDFADANPQVAVAVVRMLATLKQFGGARRFFMSLEPGEARRRAAAPLVEALAKNKRRIALRWLLWRRADVLRESDAAWGQVGFALIKSNRLGAVANWLSDWRTREKVEPWMLFNYCLGLRHLDRFQEASEVASYVTSQWSHREGAGDLHLFLAIEQALAGDTAAARENLERTEIRNGVVYDKQMSVLTRGLIDFEQVDRADRPRKFSEIRAMLNPHFDGVLFFSTMRDVRRTFERAEKVFLREGAGLGAWFWFKRKRHWQWFALPVAGAGIYGASLVSPTVLGVVPVIAIFALLRLLLADRWRT